MIESSRVFLGLITLLGVWACADSRPGADRIILIVVDTLRRDHVSAYDGRVATPNIDRLGEGGQRFDKALGSFHQTTMSMAALFTGFTPSIETGDPAKVLSWNPRFFCGMGRFAEDGDSCIPQRMTTLAEELSAADYQTVGVVANELLFRPYGYDQGFDSWIEIGRVPDGEPPPPISVYVKRRRASLVNEAVFRELDRVSNERLFLYVHYIDVHDWQLSGKEYATGVIEFDRELGKLLDGLDQRRLLEGSQVFLVSDHGEMLVTEHAGVPVRTHFGNPSFMPVLRVPLIAWPATDRDPGAMLRSQDVGDLVRETAGLASGSDSGELAPDEVFVGEMHWQTYRVGRWKSSVRRQDGRALLFDLEADPDEERNLAAERADVMEQHRQRVAELTKIFAVKADDAGTLSPQDLERLRALGYVD